MSGQPLPARKARVSNTEVVRELVSRKVTASRGKISAKRLLPVARATGYEGSDRNFRRLVADAKRAWLRDRSRSSGRRPAVWSPAPSLEGRVSFSVRRWSVSSGDADGKATHIPSVGPLLPEVRTRCWSAHAYSPVHQIPRVTGVALAHSTLRPSPALRVVR